MLLRPTSNVYRLKRRRKHRITLSETAVVDLYTCSDADGDCNACAQLFSSHLAVENSLSKLEVEYAHQTKMSIVLESLLRITCPAWTKRLWTLQEGQAAS